MQKSIRVLVLCSVAIGSLQAGFVPIDISGVANSTWTALPIPGQTGLKNAAQFPTGMFMAFGGAPVNLTGQIWSADLAAGGGSGTVSISPAIAVNLANITAVYTSINTEWGQPANSGSFAFLTFMFSNGGTTTPYTVNLIGGQDIRDYNNFNWTNTLSSSNATNLWNNGPQGQRLDAQQIPIPTNFQTQTLLSVTLTDGGNHVNPQNPCLCDTTRSQRTFLSALTVANAALTPSPEPGTVALMLGGLGALGFWRKRRAATSR